MKNKITPQDARRAHFLHLREVKKMSLRDIGAAQTPPVSGSYVGQIIGSTGYLHFNDAHLMEVHAYIKKYAKDSGFPPSLREIAETFPNPEGKPRSESVVSNWLDKLESMGKLRRTPGITRGLKAL